MAAVMVAADHGNRVVVANNSTTQKQGTSAKQTPVPCFVIFAEQLMLADCLCSPTGVPTSV